MAVDLENFQGFDLENAAVSFWVFKKSINVKTKSPVYSGRWVDLTPKLTAHLRAIAINERARVTETKDYNLLAQNNENSALTINANETLADLVVSGCAAEIDGRKASKVQEINNADFYVMKFVSGEKVLHAVRRTEMSWKAKKAAGFLNVIWSDEKLDIEEDRAFQISMIVDFIIFDGNLLIGQKKNFETILNFKEAHVAEFTTLQNEKEFLDVIADVHLLAEYVGVNKTHLRRAAVIRQKGNYKDPAFMLSLSNNMNKLKYTFLFDDAGKIVATQETCSQIMTALLDHRLLSHMDVVFEVDDAAKVN
ncbi:DUF4868 domain-containing protein [Devosia sp. WQ 349]|uniref:Kiwa anti-phage protein KwaB-like domain-containing protein n=1 Tax=Devosia sp. WQ 349K1 TaxID=2800329 RepID=UPI0019049FB2|nr:Kiwa anti-phage protein KwaB-like domain-containing protein [Devosia sp. WQ 349K1]MBK1793535.1 DUF4868 domain-containing protein [Devosia sp. WQ 349K1]